MKDHRVLSGMRPTGQLHLGHYHGVLKNWARLQNEYDSYYFVADWHAFTTHYSDKIDLEKNVADMIVDWLATGLNPNTATLFVQSKVPEHAELHLLLSMSTPLSWLERVPSFKDQQEKLKTKDLFTKDTDLTFHLKLNDDNKDKISFVKFLLNEINERVPADLDQELFDKLFGKDVIKTVTELKDKLKLDAESNFVNQTDQKLLNDVTEYLIENTKFDLPDNFLKKWMRTAGENKLTQDEANAEYEKSC